MNTKTLVIELPKINYAKIRSGVRTGSIIIDKKTKNDNFRKRKHKTPKHGSDE
jgi:hypothetical protein